MIGPSQTLMLFGSDQSGVYTLPKGHGARCANIYIVQNAATAIAEFGLHIEEARASTVVKVNVHGRAIGKYI